MCENLASSSDAPFPFPFADENDPCQNNSAYSRQNGSFSLANPSHCPNDISFVSQPGDVDVANSQANRSFVSSLYGPDISDSCHDLGFSDSEMERTETQHPEHPQNRHGSQTESNGRLDNNDRDDVFITAQLPHCEP